MHKCTQCQWEFPDDVSVCPYCGHPVEPEDKKQRIKLKWRQKPLRKGTKPVPSIPMRTQAGSITPSPKHFQVMILVIILIITLASGTTLVVLAAKNGLIAGSHPTPTPDRSLAVNPSLLDFGQVTAGSKPILSVVVKKRSASPLHWQIVPSSVQWLGITLRSEVIRSSNLREDVYDVSADTSKLNIGKYLAQLSLTLGKGGTQGVSIKIQVIAPNSSPSPAQFNVAPLLLDFGTQNVGIQKALLLTVSNSGGQELHWTLDKVNASWLSLDQESGNLAAGALPQSISVNVDTSTLTVGQHSANINFTSNGGDASVDVALSVVSSPMQGPTVSQISPTSGSSLSGDTITITGAGFTDATDVSFGTIAATNFTINSDTQITAVSPTGQGTVDITVTTSKGTSATSSADQFFYPPPPQVSSISPTSGNSFGRDIITITGSGFIGATNVSFGGTAANFTIDSDTQITTVSPVGRGTVDVTVTTPEGTSATSPADQFSYPPPIQ